MPQQPHTRPPSILGVDPSSTRTGYALMEGERLIVGGHISGGSTTLAIERIAVMADELLGLIRESLPDWVVMEIPSGKVGAKHRGYGSGLSVYGMAVGAMYQAARSLIIEQGFGLEVVLENVWTRSAPKRARRRQIATLYPQYAAVIDLDAGGDVSDAIGLALWHIDNAKLRTVKE